MNSDITLEQLFGLSGLDVQTLLNAQSLSQASPLTLGGALGAPNPVSSLATELGLHDSMRWGGAVPVQDAALLQGVAQSLAQLEERQRQQQVANALQTLCALQQQQEHDLALIQQQLNPLPRANPFQRSRTSDLEASHNPHTLDAVGGLLPSRAVDAASGLVSGPFQPLDYEQQLAALHAAHPGTANTYGLQRAARLLNNLPQRSYSSEALRVGGHRGPVAPPPQSSSGSNTASNSSSRLCPRPAHQQAPQGQTAQQQQFGAHSHGRNQGRTAEGRRVRYAATAKAPSWASSDWHPLKTVLANGAPASTGTGVFLPHLADSAKPVDTKSAPASAPDSASSTTTGIMSSSPRDGSPACSVDGVSTCSDPFSRASTLDFSRASTVEFSRANTQEFSRASTFTDADGYAHMPTACGHGHIAHACGLGAMAEEPEEEAQQAQEDECDFGALARELADLMGRQALGE